MRLRKVSVADDPESQTRKKAAWSRDRLHLNCIRAITCISKNVVFIAVVTLYLIMSSDLFMSTLRTMEILIKIFTIMNIQTL